MAEGAQVGSGVRLGEGEEAPNETNPSIYCEGLVVIGEKSVVPDGVRTGKNVLIDGNTQPEDYPNGHLASGRSLVKAGDEL